MASVKRGQQGWVHFTSGAGFGRGNRTGAPQKMAVEHVHVHDGGQAIFGNVQGVGVLRKKESQPHEKANYHFPWADSCRFARAR